MRTLWDGIIGHAAIIAGLRAAVENNRVSHAYIFTGPQGVGKFMVASALAGAVLCHEGGCGSCNACRKVTEKIHPDLSIVRPEGKNIPVDTIRAMRLDSFMRPVEADRRVYIIRDAERMWDEGASTLLKVLEEPPAGVIFILVTDNRNAVLPTIRSRCQEIRFSRIPTDELARWLVENREISEENAGLIARLSSGVVGRALEWCDQGWRLARREKVINVARSLRIADIGEVLTMAADLQKEIRAPLEELSVEYASRKEGLDPEALHESVIRRVSREIDEELKRARIKEEARGALETLSTLSWWYRDILIYKEGASRELIINGDYEGEIAVEAGSLPTRKVLRSIEVINRSIRAIGQNVPLQLNLESALFGIQEALYA